MNHAEYMRGWNKKNRERLAVQRQRKIAALLQSGVQGSRPCPTCGVLVAVTATRIVNRKWRCFQCTHAWRKHADQVAYRERHPLKTQAHAAVSAAIRSGELVKQFCETCGDIETQAHHDDYSKFLEVRWLCHRCHLAHHYPHRQVPA